MSIICGTYPTDRIYLTPAVIYDRMPKDFIFSIAWFKLHIYIALCIGGRDDD
jgi:hypothetical protein